ncbi:MAG: SprT family zinc-dependent metalloprotease [Gallionella sp.]|nr:SprT family zinc-dependent metalloprotease [Gallionella sp.]MDD4959177.1 SprT family zinc-dependent metalloprotease [Gallionella sp.]
MTIGTRQLKVGTLMVEVVRKSIKSLRLVVYRATGKVRIAVPLRVSEAEVRQVVTARLDWIRQQQDKFAQQVQPAPLEYVTGEVHPFQGRHYRLNVIEQVGTPRVLQHEDHLEMRVRPHSDRAQRAAVLAAWYRAQLQAQIPALIAHWQPIMGVQVAEWRIKQMKTKWGTCNTRVHRIWLNLELAKYPLACLEYVVVHEMTHLLEPSHNARFKALMDQFMPQWREYKKELNKGVRM